MGLLMRSSRRDCFAFGSRVRALASYRPRAIIDTLDCRISSGLKEESLRKLTLCFNC